MKDQQKNLSVLGSTGSIGRQTLDVAGFHGFRVAAISGNTNLALLEAQARRFRPELVAVWSEDGAAQLRAALGDLPVRVVSGMDGLLEAAVYPEAESVVTAVSGAVGLRPTLAAIEAKKRICLANKETLVCAGRLVMAAARKHGAEILPVDSEHSAIFQCLTGRGPGELRRILLTASGGPFRGRTRQQLEHVTLADALKHPNWSMGRKVTIDSASLMNKGLEVIEARWLFNIPAERIQVLVHPQSVVHSMVQYIDGSIKAQLGIPTMEPPIQYAFSFPARIESHLPRLDWTKYPQLTFEEPDTKTFRCLQLAYDAIARGGNMPCIMNAANEVAVQQFIDGKLTFLQIADFVEERMQQAPFIANPTLDDLFRTDAEVRAGK